MCFGIGWMLQLLYIRCCIKRAAGYTVNQNSESYQNDISQELMRPLVMAVLPNLLLSLIVKKMFENLAKFCEITRKTTSAPFSLSCPTACLRATLYSNNKFGIWQRVSDKLLGVEFFRELVIAVYVSIFRRFTLSCWVAVRLKAEARRWSDRRFVVTRSAGRITRKVVKGIFSSVKSCKGM